MSDQQPVKEGTVLYSSWGYDQTNVDFYQVVGRTPASVKVRKIGKEVVDGSGWAGLVVAVPDAFLDEDVLTKRLKWIEQVDGPAVPYVRMGSTYAWAWDGTARYSSSYA